MNIKKLLLSFLSLALLATPFFAFAKATILRPGDVLHITLPGEPTLNKNFQIDHKGRIFLPEVGELNVENKTLAAGKAEIRNKLKTVYRHINDLKITLLERQLIITVAGAVGKPGKHILPDDANFLDLINQAGGIRPNGMENKIQIFPPKVRGKRPKTPRIYNLEKFLKEGGTLDKLPKLKTGELVVVRETPGPGTSGTWIKQHAKDSIYVFSRGTGQRIVYDPSMTFMDLLAQIGGPGASTDIRDIRIIHHIGMRPEITHVNLELYFQTGDRTLLPILVPGDTIYLPAQQRNDLGINKNTIRVFGAVGRPGRVPFKDNMTILDVLLEAGGPTSAAYLKKIIVIHRQGTRYSTQTFNMKRFATSGNPTLMPVVRAGDMIFVPDRSRSPWNEFQTFVNNSFSILGILSIAGAI